MAYASVASLMGTIESLLTYNSPMKSLICDHREEFLALREKVSSLEVFLKNFERSNVSGEMTDLEVKVTEVADDVEYTIQLSLTETVMGNNKNQKKKAHQRFPHSLQQIAENIDRICYRFCKESTEVQDKGKQESKESLVQEFSSSAKEILNIKNNIVGRDDQRKSLLAELRQYGRHELKVIPIIGMGGIGKTTLAKEVYNDASIRPHFDVRAWATVSQKHNVKDILVSLLRSTRGDELYMESEADLADMLQKSLKGKRYLIVMDDMWSSEAWDDVRLCFPSENKGSRILLTTRNNEVARSAGTENLSLKIGLMDSDESWNLFQSIVFSNGELPSDAFETIGKKIVEECHGLPLAITVVAGLLNSKRTIRDWANVAKDVKSFVRNPDEQCLHVLALSYSHLPNHLKACLLYFGTFPEDSEIPVKRLVRLWIAECFLKLEKDLEGEAEKCLQDLVDRSLVLVGNKSWDELKMKSCKVHDLIHELCLREAKRENIFVMKDIAFDEEKDKYVSGFYRTLLTPGHHLLMQTDDKGNNLSNRTRSFFFLSEYHTSFTLEPRLNHFNLLRVSDLSLIEFKIFPREILGLIWLRYLAMYGNFQIPLKICRLWNLQTFIVRSSGNEFREVSEKIWELMQLRHLELRNFYLPNPPSVSVGEERHLSFSNIQTIVGLSPSSCTKEVISGIRNAKKLGICGDDYKRFQESRLLENLVHLHQLETLSFYGPLKTILSAKAFPATLKKLNLYGTFLSWKHLNIIGELPKLELLRLRSCKGGEWHPIAGGFTRLKLLLIHDCDLKYWKATNDNFPVLERLVIRGCYSLKEIPIEFAEIASLQLIELSHCTSKLKASAERIQQEQEGLGNEPVDVRISNTRAPSSFDDDDDDDDDDNDDDIEDDEDEKEDIEDDEDEKEVDN